MADERRNHRNAQSRPARGGSDRDRKPGSRAPKPYSRGRDADGIDRGTQPERTADQKAYDGPDLPDFITGKELDRGVAAQLKGLPEKLAARVGRHLAAAQHFLEVDNAEIAYQHALAAKSRAQRLAIVREAVGEAAYYAGHFDVALAELRAAKRMNGATAYLPMMADCHRALGHPEQALKLAQSPSVRNFAPAQKAEMTIIEAEARAELGQLDAALRTLELAPLMSKSRETWVVRLRYAYADILEKAGRPEEALSWFHRTLAIDAEESTDAGERAAALEANRG
ncbi:MAG: tetratricopeptide repeat protein [Nocardioides sp.]|uniref:tetratricopeptide repeat protein n=1 Tax=Nocardioides sp. TaxID=35761 RepID=UPI0039E4227B